MPVSIEGGIKKGDDLERGYHIPPQTLGSLDTYIYHKSYYNKSYIRAMYCLDSTVKRSNKSDPLRKRRQQEGE